MKKIICTVIVFAFLANVSAQLKVNSAGRVGIGTASLQYKLDVNGATRVNGGIYPGGSTSGLIATTGDVPVTFKVGGVLAGYTGSSGYRNVFFGYKALYSNTTGSLNTAIGIWADVNATDLTNATAVGFDAKATSSNQVRIGSSSVTDIGGYVAWNNISDKRTKEMVLTE